MEDVRWEMRLERSGIEFEREQSEAKQSREEEPNASSRRYAAEALCLSEATE